jgi:hypothetical protein
MWERIAHLFGNNGLQQSIGTIAVVVLAICLTLIVTDGIRAYRMRKRKELEAGGFPQEEWADHDLEEPRWDN